MIKVLYRKIKYMIKVYNQYKLLEKMYAEFCIRRYISKSEQYSIFKEYAISNNILPEVVDKFISDNEL